jgi:pimeloyl-ACP methyl ester carboxylesterase
VTDRVPGLLLTDHTFTVPLDHDRPGGETIEVYAREVTARDDGAADRPWLVYLQGGPGSAAPRPLPAVPGRPPDGWVGRAVRDYRVLMLDQRGTGRSTIANRQTLPGRGTPAEQAAYLAHFRADSIVRDAELIRRELAGDAPWSLLGQSFGGMCAVTYLSFAPGGLREVMITGGLPALEAEVDDVYRAAYPRMRRKNAAHFARYPGDAAAAVRIAAHLRDHETLLPGGGLLTVPAFQSLGLMLGMAHGSDRLHYLLEDAFLAGPDRLSDPFLAQAEAALSFAGGPLFLLLHEACLAQGGRPTGWSAERIRAEFAEFDAADPLLFTGETMHPWQLRTDPALRPLAETGELLAAWEGWTPLYDPAVLAANTVPVAALVYLDDMYVDTGYSLQTAAAIRGLRPWVTNQYEHDGLRLDGIAVLDRLISMVRGG